MQPDSAILRGFEQNIAEDASDYGGCRADAWSSGDRSRGEHIRVAEEERCGADCSQCSLDMRDSVSRQSGSGCPDRLLHLSGTPILGVTAKNKSGYSWAPGLWWWVHYQQPTCVLADRDDRSSQQFAKQTRDYIFTTAKMPGGQAEGVRIPV